MLRFYGRLAANWFRHKLANQRIDDWNVGLVRAPQSAFLDPDAKPHIEWSAYREPGQMIADPFLIPSAEQQPRVLVEEFNWATEKGRISEISSWPAAVTAAAIPQPVITPAIDDGWHMSYPYVFEYAGSLYAVPECAESRSILLYRFDPADGTWQRDRTLIENTGAVDATLFEYGGSWWLMHSGGEGCGPWSLYIWRASSPFGPWEPHRANPVKTDVSGSRPAGNPFWHEGHLYRPAQDGRASYGGAMCIHRVDELTIDVYRETLVRRIQPDPEGPYPDGIHTLSGFGPWSVVDAKRHLWPPAFILRRFLAKRLRWKRPGFRYATVTLHPPPRQTSSGRPQR
jgi:hypothetical protein